MMVATGEGAPKAVGGGCRDGWWRRGITWVATWDGSRDRVPFPDQSRARGKGTLIEMITTGRLRVQVGRSSPSL